MFGKAENLQHRLTGASIKAWSLTQIQARQTCHFSNVFFFIVCNKKKKKEWN